MTKRNLGKKKAIQDGTLVAFACNPVIPSAKAIHSVLAVRQQNQKTIFI